MQSLQGNWNYPTAVRFGPGRITELSAILRERGLTAPLVVTDEGLAKLPFVADIMASLDRAGLRAALFSGVGGNPTGSQVEAGLQVMRSGSHDCVVALGGGSALDAGKAIALMKGQTRPLWDFEDREDWYTRVDPAGVAPTIAIPTTSGTGSEVGRASVITDEAEKVKKIIFHPTMLPQVVLCDPALTVGLPPALTAATGMDALSHNLEALCAPGFHPLADGIATEGIRLIHQALLPAYLDGSDLQARSRMMAASLMGATAFQKGLGAMHGIAHVVGARLGAHHGLLNAIVMPYVLQHNRKAVDEPITRLARALGLTPSFDAVFEWILFLRKELGIPDTLDAVGMTAEMIPVFAEASVADPSTGTNPVAMDAEGYAAIYRAALGGEG